MVSDYRSDTELLRPSTWVRRNRKRRFVLILALKLIGVLSAAKMLFLQREEDRGVEWDEEDQ